MQDDNLDDASVDTQSHDDGAKAAALRRLHFLSERLQVVSEEQRALLAERETLQPLVGHGEDQAVRFARRRRLNYINERLKEIKSDKRRLAAERDEVSSKMEEFRAGQ